MGDSIKWCAEQEEALEREEARRISTTVDFSHLYKSWLKNSVQGYSRSIRLTVDPASGDFKVILTVVNLKTNASAEVTGAGQTLRTAMEDALENTKRMFL